MFEQPEKEPTSPEPGPRSFFYEDKDGNRQSIEGALEETEGPRAFWYRDPSGKRKRIEGKPLPETPGTEPPKPREFFYDKKEDQRDK